MVRNEPVETIPSQIHEPPTPGHVRLEGIELGARDVLGVAPRQHDRVVREQFDTVTVEVLVGDGVPSDALALEPVDDRQVGRELPEGVRHEPGPVTGAHVDDRPAPGAEEDAGAVGVDLVAGVPEVVVALKLEVVRMEHRHMADQQLGAGGVERQMVVGIRQVRPRREEHGDPVALPARGRPDEERHVFLAAWPRSRMA